MKLKHKTQPVVLFNPITSKARYFSSVALAAEALSLDTSTVHRAMTGDRGCKSAANHFVIAVN